MPKWYQTCMTINCVPVAGNNMGKYDVYVLSVDTGNDDDNVIVCVGDSEIRDAQVQIAIDSEMEYEHPITLEQVEGASRIQTVDEYMYEIMEDYE